MSRLLDAIDFDNFDNGIKIVIDCLPSLDIAGLVAGLIATLDLLLFYTFNYGTESDQFIQYHMNRTSCMIAFVKAIPAMCFYIIVRYLFDDDVVELISDSIPIHYLKLASFLVNLLAIVTCLKVLRWKWNCRLHPLVRNITKLLDNGDDWKTLASQINESCHSSNTLWLQTGWLSRYVVTPTWFIRINPYTVTLIRLRGAFLASMNYSRRKRFVNVIVCAPLQDNIEPFTVKLSLVDYERVRVVTQRYLTLTIRE